TLTGAAAVNAVATATGGAGGALSGAGGAASATLTAQAGTGLSAQAIAHGGTGASKAGMATATVKAAGASGTFGAFADTSLGAGQLIRSASASAGGGVDGASTAKAQAAIGGAAAAFSSGLQAIALETAAPDGASSGAVLAANASIAAAFGASPTFFAIGELGGGYSVGGAASQTVTSEIDETVDLTKLAARQDLPVGLYDGKVKGAGFTGLTFDLYADGMDVVHQAFTSAAAAQSYFTDHPIDLGSLASGALSGNSLTLRAVLSVTSASGGSGFYGDLILGDPPAAATPAAAPQRFAQAMAGLGAAGAGASPTAFAEARREAHPMLTGPHMALA
ncbi:MAG: hypothetical protein ACR2F8_10155, partial [Caulobacteraceae bacterium]